MLGRRILRIKDFKVVYSYAENPGMSLKEAETQLELSCESTRDLYLFMLSVIVPLTEEARLRIESARQKFNPTAEEANPNMKFVGNAVAEYFANDAEFQKVMKRKKLGWDQYDVLLRNLYEKIREREYFKKYMSSPEKSIAEDAKLWIRIFEKEFEDNDDLYNILEDLSIYWNDDLPYALTWCCRTLEELADGGRWSMLPLYQSDLHKGADSDKAFSVNLLRKAILDFDKYYAIVAEATPKWDKNRICATDLALLVCGLAEADAFPLTPVRVIINEYVEISKFYSTPESRAFVNGVLDRLINKKQQ